MCRPFAVLLLLAVSTHVVVGVKMEGAVEFSTNSQAMDADEGANQLLFMTVGAMSTQENFGDSGREAERDHESMEIDFDNERNLGKRSNEEATEGPNEKALRVGTATKGIMKTKPIRSQGSIAEYLIKKSSMELAKATPNKLSGRGKAAKMGRESHKGSNTNRFQSLSAEDSDETDEEASPPEIPKLLERMEITEEEAGVRAKWESDLKRLTEGLDQDNRSDEGTAGTERQENDNWAYTLRNSMHGEETNGSGRTDEELKQRRHLGRIKVSVASASRPLSRSAGAGQTQTSNSQEDCEGQEKEGDIKKKQEPSYEEQLDEELIKEDAFDMEQTLEGTTYLLRPTRTWKPLLQGIIRKEITEKEALEEAEFTLGIRKIEGQERATPDDGWSGYVALLQAKWMNAARSKRDAMVCADLRNPGFRKELASHITKIANGAINMLTVAEILEETEGRPLERLTADLQFQVGTEIHRTAAGPVTWFVKDGNVMWYQSSTIRTVSTRLKISDVERIMETVKIGGTMNRFFLLAGPCVFKGGITGVIHQHLLEGIKDIGADGQERRRAESATTQRRQIELLSEEETREVNRMFIYNIPSQMKRSLSKWQRDMTVALDTVPQVKVTQTELWTAMQKYVDTIDGDATFGIIAKCAKILAGTGANPTHFVMLGESREFLEGERPTHYMHKIRTRYMVHMLTEEEAKLLPNAVVQCFFRGCVTEHEVNNFLRIVVGRYLLDISLSRLPMVQIKRHRLDSGFVNETVIVVYALGENLDAKIRDGNVELGLSGSTFSRRVEYGGLSFEMVPGYVGVKGPVPHYVYEDKPVIILAHIWATLTYSEVTDLLEQVIDLRHVAYWIFREVYQSRPRSLAIGLNSTLVPRIADTPILRKLLDVSKKGWRLDRNNLFFREFRKPTGVEEVLSPEVISGITSQATPSSEPKQRMQTPRSYSAAVATPTEKQILAVSDMVVMVRKQIEQYEQRIQNQITQYNARQEGRLTQAERTASALAERIDTLTRENNETKMKLEHIMGQEDRIVDRLGQLIRSNFGSPEEGRRNE